MIAWKRMECRHLTKVMIIIIYRLIMNICLQDLREIGSLTLEDQTVQAWNKNSKQKKNFSKLIRKEKMNR
jgi:hypothetical protein